MDSLLHKLSLIALHTRNLAQMSTRADILTQGDCSAALSEEHGAIAELLCDSEVAKHLDRMGVRI